MFKANLKKIAATGVLTALAYIVMFFFRFPVAGFLTLDFKDAVLGIISLLYGPFYGVVSSLLVAFLEFITVSTTGWYGFLMNFFASGTFSFVLGTVYHYRRNFFGAIIGTSLSVFFVTAVMLFANMFITPLYFGMPRSAVIELIPKVLLPFNLCKSIINSSIMLIIYKPFTTALKKARLISAERNVKYRFSLKSAILVIVCSALIVLSALFITLKLNG